MLRYVFGGLAALMVVGIARAPHRPVQYRVVPDASATETSAPIPAVAYHPGEPSLVPGASTELPRAANGHFYTSASVNGQSVEMVVDTGATAVALTIDDARRLGIAVDPASFRVVGSGASGPVRGVAVTLDDVAVGGRHVGQVEAAVLDGLDQSLLGQSYLRRLDQVAINGDTMTLR